MAEDLHKGAAGQLFLLFQRENRKVLTEAERVLRDRKVHGFKFRRQQPIADFVADFYCHECNLIVELDGEYHNRGEGPDSYRDRVR